ncbi:MAG: hypothetical protein QT00_C0002G0229 [archaeon GW2011_AR5]|nr:MAG: hypothetical protein QT00_C0002G0229 [archaeon GW2011_AR5]
MKGFAKIFEAIVASIILLASLTFFFTPNVQKSEWDSTSLQIMAEDALESAYLNGTLARFVKTDNTTQLNAFFSEMLPKTVDFSIEVRGIPGKTINIACIGCSQTNLDDLSAIIANKDFTYKKKNTSINIQTLDLATQDVPEGAGILFFFDKSKIAVHQTKINDFLDTGGGVFLLSSLDSTDVGNTPIGNTFGLTWSGGTSNLQGRFEDVDGGIFNSNKPSHFIARYYANISTRHLPNVQTDPFSVFVSTGIGYQADGKDIVKTPDSRSYVRSNQIGRGRTIWLNDYNRVDHTCASCGPTRDTDNLTKAGIMWVSGERSKLDMIEKTPAPVNFKSSIFVFDGDVYIVDLTIWRIFF